MTPREAFSPVRRPGGAALRADTAPGCADDMHAT